ncbi:uncharacterized protein si:rp71-15k1.1 isoform X2 [Puntigrus tetrazona]|nr:uncharacterized protein si:rp71-15k1.1 isoform X2 [Puntigrus tetrazona]
MKKILAILSLTAFLCCCGVQSDGSYDLRQQILNSGTVVFLDFLEKVRNATEKLVRDDQFRKSRVSIQGYVEGLRELAKPRKDSERATESQESLTILPQRFFTLMAGGTFGATFRQVFDEFFYPYIKIYRETLKNDTMADIWKEVESYYLPGAPPVYSKPMQFFSHLLAKAVVKSQLVNMLEAGVNTVIEIGKVDFNQLHEDVQILMDQIRQKAFEISVLERQKEKNDFLISLRTASVLIVFYWDKVLEHTESPPFHAKYLDSMKQWAELTKLKNSSEKYHVLLDPETKRSFLEWKELYFSEFCEAATQEYYNRGNAALGLERFNQSTWAVAKSVVVYSLPVYEKLSEVGFGISEINRFLLKVNHITLTLEGNRLSSNRQTMLEELIRITLYLLTAVIDKEKTNSKDNYLLLPLRIIRKLVVTLWSEYLRFEDRAAIEGATFNRTMSEWNDMRNIIIDELVKSNAFTRKQLEEAPKNFVQAIHQTLDKLNQYSNLFDGFDERIDPTFVVLKNSMLRSIDSFNDFWDLLLE